MFGLKKKFKPAGGNGGSDQDLDVKDLSDQVPSTADAMDQIKKALRSKTQQKKQKKERGCGCWG